MWELDYKESWAPKNWCFWTVVLEKTLESPLDCKEIKPVHPNGNQSWIFIGKTDAEAETSILWPPWEELTLWKRPWCWERLKAGGERMTEDGMVWWHHWLNGPEFEQILGHSERQGSLMCCSSRVERIGHNLANEQLFFKHKALPELSAPKILYLLLD